LNKRLRKEEDCVKEMEFGIREIAPKIYVSEEEDMIVEEENREITTEQEISEDENMMIREDNKRTRDSDDGNNRKKKRKTPIGGLKKNLPWDINIRIQKVIDALERVNTEITDEEEIDEKVENLTLKQLDNKAGTMEKRMIEIYFYLGKRFNERLGEIRKRRKKSEKDEKGKIYDEILGIDKDNRNKRRALVERIRVSKKIHEIFIVVGMEKLKRTEC
jgi:molecular chaperone GrpE (heat shock protein)